MAAPASSVSASATWAAASAPRSRVSPAYPSPNATAGAALRRARSRPDEEPARFRRTRRSPRRQQRKEQHLGVEADVVQAWQRLAPEGLQHSNADASQHESEHAAKERQHETLDQELPREPGPAGTERGAYGELVHAAGRSNEGEVGHVHAGHEQDEPHGGEDQVQRASRLCDELLVQRRGDDGALFCGRPAFPHRPRQRSQLGLGLFQSVTPLRSRPIAVSELFSS